MIPLQTLKNPRGNPKTGSPLPQKVTCVQQNIGFVVKTPQPFNIKLAGLKDESQRNPIFDSEWICPIAPEAGIIIVGRKMRVCMQVSVCMEIRMIAASGSTNATIETDSI
jgi:hypothetical protein